MGLNLVLFHITNTAMVTGMLITINTIMGMVIITQKTTKVLALLFDLLE